MDIKTIWPKRPYRGHSEEKILRQFFYSNFFVIITGGKQLDEQRSHLVQQVDGTWWAGLPPQVAISVKKLLDCLVIHVNSNSSWLWYNLALSS